MEQKHIFSMKHLAIVLLILLAGVQMRYCFSEFEYMVTNCLYDYFSTYYDVPVFLLQCAANIFMTFLATLGFVMIGLSLFGQKPRNVALCGVAVLMLSVLVSAAGDWMVMTLVYLFRDGFDVFLEVVFSASFFLEQSYMLLLLVTYAAAAVVLLMHKKAPRIFCFAPSLLMVCQPFYYVIANVSTFLIEDYRYDGWFAAIIMGAGFVPSLIQAVAFALLLLEVTAREAKPALAVEEAAAE